MYDEVIQRTLRRKKLQLITFDTEYLGELLDNFRSTAPKSVILTGTAGDGKTYYYRQIWEEFGGSVEDWQNDSKISRLGLSVTLLGLLAPKDNIIADHLESHDLPTSEPA